MSLLYAVNLVSNAIYYPKVKSHATIDCSYCKRFFYLRVQVAHHTVRMSSSCEKCYLLLQRSCKAQVRLCDCSLKDL